MSSLLHNHAVLIIVPAYNEQEAIEATIYKLKKLKRDLPNVDICVVNDGSTDGTSAIVKKHPEIILIDLPNNLGIGGAVQTGYKYADQFGYDIAVQFDADGQHNEDDLLTLLIPVVKDDCDMCIGSRFVEKTAYSGSRFRRMGIYYFQ